MKSRKGLKSRSGWTLERELRFAEWQMREREIPEWGIQQALKHLREIDANGGVDPYLWRNSEVGR